MVGDKIKKYRLALGWTQEELAKKLGYRSKSTINKIELNIHDVAQTKLLKFANVLGVNPSDLIDDAPYVIHDSNEFRKYAEMLQQLSPAARDNAIKYIEYLLSKDREKGDEE